MSTHLRMVKIDFNEHYPRFKNDDPKDVPRVHDLLLGYVEEPEENYGIFLKVIRVEVAPNGDVWVKTEPVDVDL